jgi:hypothetical protein
VRGGELALVRLLAGVRCAAVSGVDRRARLADLELADTGAEVLPDGAHARPRACAMPASC